MIDEDQFDKQFDRDIDQASLNSTKIKLNSRYKPAPSTNLIKFVRIPTAETIIIDFS